MLDIGRGYDVWVGGGGGEGMVSERRQEHVSMSIYTHYLAWQCSVLTT